MVSGKIFTLSTLKLRHLQDSSIILLLKINSSSSFDMNPTVSLQCGSGVISLTSNACSIFLQADTEILRSHSEGVN